MDQRGRHTASIRRRLDPDDGGEMM